MTEIDEAFLGDAGVLVGFSPKLLVSRVGDTLTKSIDLGDD